MKYLKKYWLLICAIFVFFTFYKPIICFILLGTMALALGIYHLHFLSSIQKNGIITKGKIVSYRTDNLGYKTPIIEFITLKSRKVIRQEPFYYTATDISIILDYEANKTISIMYDQNNPKNFIINKESKFSYVSLWLIIAIGLSFFVIGVAQLLNYINLGF